MNKTVRYFGILLILQLMLAFQLKSQVYPVQLNTQLIPPYSLKLSDYVAPGTNRAGLNMILTDLNKPEYYVRLELTIEGDGITIKTSPSFNPGPVILEGGVPQFLTSSDLASYFNPQNLDFSGYSKSDYLANGRLPEGVYRFSFRAYDYNKGVRVSNNSSITAWLLLNEPPVINMPMPDHKVEHIDPQNIVFQWTPRHTGSPNSAFTTDYEFTLVEIWPEGRDPNNAIQTSIPIYQTTTTNNSLVYGLSEPFLEPGRKYAYRIQARDMDGRDMFKNNGYSEVRMFTFGDECKLPTNLQADAYRFNEAEISWQPAFTQTAFNVRYRKANDPDAEWFEEETFVDHLKIIGLEEATQYEYQVMGYCGTYEGDYTDTKTFTTPVPNITDFDCGTSNDDVAITNHDPLPVLQKGDYIQSGNFTIKISETTGENGTFSGKGFALIPYLGFVKLQVEFENIKVNTDKQVWEGEISSVYVPDSPFFVDLDETFGDDDEDDDTGGDDDSGDGTDDSEINDTTLNTVVDSVYIVEDEDIIVIINDDGTTDTIPNTDDIIITDENDDTWVVDDGVITPPGGGGGDEPDTPTVNDPDEISIKVAFQPYENQNFGYDQLTYDVHKTMYEQVNVDGETQYAPWKSVSTTGSDRVLVKFSDYDTTITPGNVEFRTTSGMVITPLEYEGKEDMRMLMFNGKTHEETEGIEAYITYIDDKDDEEKELILGKFNTISYDKQTVNLKIVPVNGTTDLSIADFTEAINNIYKQSVVEWNITLDDEFYIDTDDWDKDNDGKMNDGESTLLSKYSDEQNKLRRKYKRQTTIDNQTYYVFLLNGIESKSGLAGYMPLKSQYGFIYSGNIDTRTIAHELAHGAFRLWHTFSTESDFLLPQNTSDNLMDYNDGERLHKYQWDAIHDPAGGLYLFQDEEEAAMVSEDENLNTTITETKGSTFVQGEDFNLDVSFKIEGWNELTEKYPSEKHLIRAMVFNNDDELIYQDDDISLADEGTVTWNGTYTNSDGEKLEIDASHAPYRFVVTAFCGKDPQEIEDELDCAILGPTACYLKKLLEGKEAAVELMRSLYSDSVLVVESHDVIEINYEERNLAERLLKEIKDANINHASNLEITEFYNEAPDPSYMMTANINDKNIPLFIIHKLSDNEHKIYPLKEDISGPHELEDGTYNHKLEFEGDNNIYLQLRTKNEEDMTKLIEYLFIPTYDFDEETINDIIEDISDATSGMACNFCVRDAFFRITGSDILYPYDDTNNVCHSCEEDNNRPEGGMVDGNGQANDIYDEITNGDLSSYFEKIDDMDGEEYPNFAQMQESVNNGQIIIGAYYNSDGSGHVVIMMPERFYVEQDNDNKYIKIDKDTKLQRPISLECGTGTKRIRPSFYDEVQLSDFVWYKYNP